MLQKTHTDTHKKETPREEKEEEEKITQYILGKGINKIIKKVKIIFVLSATL